MDVQSKPSYLPSSAGSGGRVLITQFPDEEDDYSVVTQHSHVLDSSIPEENEDDLEGRLSNPKTNASRYSPDCENNALREDRQGKLTMGRYLLEGGSGDMDDRVSVEGEEEEEEDEQEGSEKSFVDSMSMDNVSDTFSTVYDQPTELKDLKDEDFDTDLEMDDDRWLHPEKYDHDTTGLTKYLNACEDHEVTPVRYFIKHMLEDTMNLGHHGLGPAAIKALAVPLENNTSIERLDLEGNWIETEGVQHLCRVLKENVYITHLNLAENKMGNSGAGMVLELMYENRTIEWLDLTGNQINDNSGQTLVEMLKKNNTLRHLRLRHNELGEGVAQWLKGALSDNDNLESLDISWNHFQTRGCVLLAEGLKENVGLREVNISMNGFGLEGAIALGEVIKVNRTLLRLNASYARLPPEGSVALANGLQVNETLQALDVGANSLGPEGTLALLLGLDRNDCSSMAELDLGNTRVLPQFRQLQDRLERERPLRVFHGGVMLEVPPKEIPPDAVEAFKRDPMTKLKEWVEQAGYRLIDLLNHFDKDKSFTISRQEFVTGVKSIDLPITDEQIDILLDRLDVDGDGEIDFGPWVNDGELIQVDKDHRTLKRDIKRFEEEQSMRDVATETELTSFLRKPLV